MMESLDANLDCNNEHITFLGGIVMILTGKKQPTLRSKNRPPQDCAQASVTRLRILICLKDRMFSQFSTVRAVKAFWRVNGLKGGYSVL